VLTSTHTHTQRIWTTRKHTASQHHSTGGGDISPTHTNSHIFICQWWQTLWFNSIHLWRFDLSTFWPQKYITSYEWHIHSL